MEVKDSMFDYSFDRDLKKNVFEKNTLDSVAEMNKCVVIDNSFDW
jgi:hypothetical protein